MAAVVVHGVRLLHGIRRLLGIERVVHGVGVRHIFGGRVGAVGALEELRQPVCSAVLTVEVKTCAQLFTEVLLGSFETLRLHQIQSFPVIVDFAACFHIPFIIEEAGMLLVVAQIVSSTLHVALRQQFIGNHPRETCPYIIIMVLLQKSGGVLVDHVVELLVLRAQLAQYVLRLVDARLGDVNLLEAAH